MRISRKSSGWKLPLYTWRNSGRHPAGRLGFFHDRAGLSKYLTQTFMSHGNEMICQPVTLSGYAEWPKVADAVIEAEPWIFQYPRMKKSISMQMTPPQVGSG